MPITGWSRRFRGELTFLVGYLSATAALIAMTVYAGHSVLGTAVRNAPELAAFAGPVATKPALVVTASAVLQDFEWGPTARSSRRLGAAAGGGADRGYSRRRSDDDDDDDRPRNRDRSWDRARSGGLFGRLFDDDDDDEVATPRYSSTYRTVCVRLCDGAYWPISFAADPSHFSRDSLSCTSSCDGPAKLYVYRNPGEEMEQAVDLRGQPYMRLKTAFLYRQTYNESCRCKPQPWAQASLDRHSVYALESRARKGDKGAREALPKARADLRRVEVEAREQVRTDAEKAYTAATGLAAPTVAAAPRLAAPRFGGSSEDGDAESYNTFNSRRRAAAERPREIARASPPPDVMRLGAPPRERAPERKSPGESTDWQRKVYNQ